MFKKDFSDNQLSLIYFCTLMFTGFVLFVLSALLYDPFKSLVTALNSKDNAPIWVWVISGSSALLVGTFWLSVYMIFAAAKKGLVDLIHKKQIQSQEY